MSIDATAKNIRDLLPHGSQQRIATDLGVTKQSVSEALKNGKPNHPAVIAALKIIQAAGSDKAAKSIKKLIQ